MSDPSNHPADGERPTVREPAAATPLTPAEPVAPQTPPVTQPVPPAAPPPPPPGAAPGGGWSPPPPPGTGAAWWGPGYRRHRPLGLLIAVGLLGVLLGCLLGGGITLVATHLRGWDRAPARPGPMYGPRRGPGFAPRNGPGFGPYKVVPAPTASPSR